ncbi:uncharacterized protein LOC125763154 [Anopheles funestus]|uniref:uncharacterized protein LOC125763154 n=1 Tax=Anopheles funestus TaxID=62324 RepID=UPI0020C5FEA8|nr:uncharacterized protein LOC125763154 [Anopheles funestus]
MKLFWTVQMVIVLVLQLTSSLPTGSLPTENASEASETAEDVTTEMEPPTTTTSINPIHNEVNTSDDEIPTFNRNQVNLDLPNDLFSSTANLTFRLRNFIGDFITRASVRIAQVVRFFQPVFGYHLMIDIPKELDV